MTRGLVSQGGEVGKYDQMSRSMKVLTAIKMLYRAFLRDEEYARYYLLEKAGRYIYPRYRFSDFGSIWLDDDAFREWFDRMHPNSSRSIDRKFTLAQFVKLVREIPGDTAECGALRGATSYLICQGIKGTGKQHHVFDSFEGLSKPNPEKDGAYWRRGDLAESEAACRETLREFDFVHFHKGWIPERFGDVAERRFSLVHVDVDLYQPTRDSVEFFWPRMNAGGVLICDDYGSRWCPGAKKAMDEYFEGVAPVLLLTTGQGVVIKPSLEHHA